MRDLLNKLFEIQQQIHEGFGYQEQWRVFPIVDCRNVYWRLEGGTIRYWDTREAFDAHDENHEYTSEVYAQCHLTQSVWHADGHTMILMDANCDLNVYLGVFDDAKRIEP